MKSKRKNLDSHEANQSDDSLGEVIEGEIILGQTTLLSSEVNQTTPILSNLPSMIPPRAMSSFVILSSQTLNMKLIGKKMVWPLTFQPIPIVCLVRSEVFPTKK